MKTTDLILLCEHNLVYFYMLMFRKAITIILMQAISKFPTFFSSVYKVYKIHLLVPSAASTEELMPL